MLKLVCCVYDKTIASFAHPFVSFNEGSAVRDFGHAARDPASALSKSPEDFSLILIAHFDDETGEVMPVQHKTLAQAAQFVQE